MAVSDYPNGTAPKSALTLWQGMWIDPVLVPELEFVKAYCEARGVSFAGTQGYRWLGVPSDYNVRDESNTSDGTANQWYVKGVESRGGASAATPGYSNHGRGLSVDVRSDGPDWQAVRDEAFSLVGWDRDVAGESWHYTKKRPARVDLSAYAGNVETVIKRMEQGMTVAITDPKGTGILIFPGGEYAVSGSEGSERDGVAADDRNSGGVIDAVWGKRVPLNQTDVNTVMALNAKMTAVMKAALK